MVVVRVVPEGEDPVERLNPFAPRRHAGGAARVSRRWALIGGIVLVLALIAISIPLLVGGGAGSTSARTRSRAWTRPTAPWSSPRSSASDQARARSGSGACGSRSRTAVS